MSLKNCRLKSKTQRTYLKEKILGSILSARGKRVGVFRLNLSLADQTAAEYLRRTFWNLKFSKLKILLQFSVFRFQRKVTKTDCCCLQLTEEEKEEEEYNRNHTRPNTQNRTKRCFQWTPIFLWKRAHRTSTDHKHKENPYIIIKLTMMIA